MYIFQQIPAETTSYMIAGYAVILGVMLLYLVSLVLRRRNLQKELQMLEDLDKTGK